MQTLLVPLDDTSFATAAVEVARDVARHSGATLHLLSVTPADRHDALLDELERFGGALGVPVSVEVLAGDTLEAVVDSAHRLPDCTICLTDRGRGALADLVTGSLATDILARSTRPVLIVGPCATDAEISPAGTLVVCVDDTPECEAIVGPAADLANGLGLGITLVEVVPPEERVEMDGVPPVDAPTALGRRRLTGVAAALAARGVETVEPVVLYGAEVADSIAYYADEHDVVGVALATHGRAGVRRLLHGSTTQQLITRVPCPVLAIRCDQPD